MADGKVEIDVELNTDSVQSDADKVKQTLESVFSGDKTKAKVTVDTTDAKAKVDTFDKAINKLPKKSVTQLQALAKKAGITDFKKWVKSIPEKNLTELIAKADTMNVNSFKKAIDQVPKKTETDIQGKDKGAGDTAKKVKNEVDKIPKTHNTDITATDHASGPLNSIASIAKGSALGMGAMQVATKAVSTAMGDLGGAVSRYDTLNNFPKVMQSMGASSGDAKNAINTLKDGINGLPTSLDEVAKTTQVFMPMSKNADEAAKATLALNDAFLASNASTEDASRGLEQYKQMLAAGKVDSMAWKSLEETMPASLQKVAQSFGFAGKSAKQDLFNALQDGKITMEDLNKRFIELDGGANGFHKQALNATAGIGTAFKNMHARIKIALTEIIGGVDSMVKSISGKSISGWINKATSNISKAGTAIGKELTKLGKDMSNWARSHQGTISVIKTLVGVLATFLAGILAMRGGIAVIGAVAKGFQALKTVKTIVTSIKSFTGAFKLLQFVLTGTTGPFGAAALVIIAVASAFIYAYKHSKTFRDIVNKTAKAISKTFGKAIKAIPKLLKSAGEWFSNTGKSIQKTINNVQKWFDNLGKGFQKTLNSIKSWWNDTWEGIGDFIKKIWDTISKTVGTTFNNVAKAFSNTLDGIKDAWETVWNGIKDFIGGIWDGIVNACKTGINAMIDVINGGIGGVNAVISFFGGSKNAIGKIKKLASGTDSNTDDELALVNDEGGDTYREAIVRSDGRVEIPKGRNRLAWLNRGDKVIPARQTAEMFGLNKYAKGKGSGILSGLAKKASSIAKILASPLSYLQDLFGDTVGNVTGEAWQLIGDGAVKKMPSYALEWFKKQLTKLKEALGDDDDKKSSKKSKKSKKKAEDGGWTSEPAEFGEIPGEPELAINPARSSADSHIVQAIRARAQQSPNGFASRLNEIISGQRAGADKIMSYTAGGNATLNSVGNSTSPSVNGNINLTFAVDGKKMATQLFPINKAMQAREVIVRNSGGATPIGHALPVGGGY